MNTAATFLAGAAETDITPPIGTPQTGFIGRPGPSDAIHDHLAARALALRLGTCTVLLITCDLLALSEDFVARTRLEIERRTAIAAEDILIACTHTHAGPATVFLRDCGDVQEDYLELLHVRLISLAQQALAALQPARLGHASVSVPEVSFNRRHPGLPVDDRLHLAALKNEHGAYIAILANFTCHAVCLRHDNLSISADYPGQFARLLSAHTGCPVLFANGACGDVNPVQRETFEAVHSTAEPLSAAALLLLSALQYRTPTSLRTRQSLLSLPLLPPPSLAELAAIEDAHTRQLQGALASGVEIQIQINRAMLGWVKDTRIGLLEESLPTSLPGEVQVIALDDLVFAGVNGELFNEPGREIKDAAPGRHVLLLGYANGDIGYLAPPETYLEGGYETGEAYRYYGTPSAITPQAVQALVAEAKRLVSEI